MPDSIAVIEAQKRAKKAKQPTDPKSAYDAVQNAKARIYTELNPYLVH